MEKGPMFAVGDYTLAGTKLTTSIPSLNVMAKPCVCGRFPEGTG